MAEFKRPEKVRIVYFSGTGGTEKAAALLAESLAGRGTDIRLQELSVKAQADESFKEDLLVVAFPVYAFSAPGPVFDYIKNRQRVDGTAAAVVSVSGGGEVTPNNACRRRAIRLLERKGYRVIYERMLVMPSNVFVKTPMSAAVWLLRVLPDKISRVTEDLLNSITRRLKPGPADILLSVVGEGEKLGARMLGRHIKAGPTCIGCGICAANCPVGNISLTDGRPVFGKKCVTCLKCFYHCPAAALTPGFGKFIVLKGGFSLAEIEKAAADKTLYPKPEFGKGTAWAGLKSYIEEKG